MTDNKSSAYHQAYRRQMREIIISKAVLRHALLQNRVVLDALNRYITSLQLERRVNAGLISDTEALIEFERAIHLFARKVHTSLNRRWTVERLDETDLSKPENLQAALNNPNAFASQEMAAMAVIINDAINLETMQNEAAYAQYALDDQAQQTQNTQIENNFVDKTVNTQQQENNATVENAPENMTATHRFSTAEKLETLTAAITIFDEKGALAAKDKIEAAFFKETGLKSKFHQEDTSEVKSIIDRVLKPSMQTFEKGSDDKTKG